MYIRVLNFQTNGNKKAEAIDIMNTLIPNIKAQKGCRDCMFLTHPSDNYVLLVFWESKEHADAAATVIGPLMIPALSKISREPVMPMLYEVYEPALTGQVK